MRPTGGSGLKEIVQGQDVTELGGKRLEPSYKYGGEGRSQVQERRDSPPHDGNPTAGLSKGRGKAPQAKKKKKGGGPGRAKKKRCPPWGTTGSCLRHQKKSHAKGWGKRASENRGGLHKEHLSTNTERGRKKNVIRERGKGLCYLWKNPFPSGKGGLGTGDLSRMKKKKGGGERSQEK